MYEILVNPNDYKDIYLFNSKPIFLEGESIGETIGELSEDSQIVIDENYIDAYPSFHYYVNGKKYRRIQKVVVPIDSPLVLQKGMNFRVRYLLENSQRSILDYNLPRFNLLEKPV